MRRYIPLFLIAAATLGGVMWNAVKVYADWDGVSASGNVHFCSKTTSTPNVANCVVPVEPNVGIPTTGGTLYHAATTATSGGMTVNVKSSAGLVLGVQVLNTTTTLGDFRLINLGSAPTCSTGGGATIGNWPVQSNAIGPGWALSFPGGIYMSAGISFCYTGAVSDTDTTTPATGTQINILYN